MSQVFTPGTLIVLLIIAGLVYLTVRYLRTHNSCLHGGDDGGCSSCSGCSACSVGTLLDDIEKGANEAEDNHGQDSGSHSCSCH